MSTATRPVSRWGAQKKGMAGGRRTIWKALWGNFSVEGKRVKV